MGFCNILKSLAILVLSARVVRFSHFHSEHLFCGYHVSPTALGFKHVNDITKHHNWTKVMQTESEHRRSFTFRGYTDNFFVLGHGFPTAIFCVEQTPRLTLQLCIHTFKVQKHIFVGDEKKSLIFKGTDGKTTIRNNEKYEKSKPSNRHQAWSWELWDASASDSAETSGMGTRSRSNSCRDSFSWKFLGSVCCRKNMKDLV